MSRNAQPKAKFLGFAQDIPRETTPPRFRMFRVPFSVYLVVSVSLLVPPAFASPPALPIPGPSGAEIVVIENPAATTNLQARPEPVRDMVRKGVAALTGEPDSNAAWLRLVSAQDVIGLKVYSAPGPNSGTRLAVVAAVIEGLLSASVPASNIIIWDKHSIDLRLSGYYALAARYNVRIASSGTAGFDPGVFYESAIIGNLVWGDLEFGKEGSSIGRKSYVTKLLTSQITKIINIPPLLNHNYAGVSGTLFSLASGSVDNFFRFESDRARIATAVPEIYGIPELADHVALNIVDALLCQYEGGERSLLHYSAVLNQLWFSRDPVALDVTSLQELNRQRKSAGAPTPKSPLALYENASLLELGTSDTNKIRLIKPKLIPTPPAATQNQPPR